MSKKKRGFTKKEDDLIRSNYGVLTVQQIADRLGRSRSGISARIKVLGLLEAKLEKKKIVSIKTADCIKESVSSAAASGSRLRALIALRDALAGAVDIAPARDLPRFAKELGDVLRQIDEIEKEASGNTKETMLNVIRADFLGGRKPKAKAQG